MNRHVLVWDLETIPDLAAVAQVNGLDATDETGARAALGGKFLKLPYPMFSHSNVRLPERIDRVLRWIVVTPDMHRVHH